MLDWEERELDQKFTNNLGIFINIGIYSIKCGMNLTFIIINVKFMPHLVIRLFSYSLYLYSIKYGITYIKYLPLDYFWGLANAIF